MNQKWRRKEPRANFREGQNAKPTLIKQRINKRQIKNLHRETAVYMHSATCVVFIIMLSTTIPKDEPGLCTDVEVSKIMCIF